jgi:hypothetical protein
MACQALHVPQPLTLARRDGVVGVFFVEPSGRSGFCGGDPVQDEVALSGFRFGPIEALASMIGQRAEYFARQVQDDRGVHVFSPL